MNRKLVARIEIAEREIFCIKKYAKFSHKMHIEDPGNYIF